MDEVAPSDGPSARSGLVQAALDEVAALLADLATGGAGGAIDLRSLPLAEADRAELGALLGHGEVEVRLAIGGTSDVYETAYAGVWWLRHRAADGSVSSEQIAVTPVPDIIPADPTDIRAASVRLACDLGAARTGRDAQENAHG